MKKKKQPTIQIKKNIFRKNMFLFRLFRRKKPVTVEPTKPPPTFYVDLIHDGKTTQGGYYPNFVRWNKDAKKYNKVVDPMYYRLITAIHNENLTQNPDAFLMTEFNFFALENNIQVRMQTLDL